MSRKILSLLNRGEELLSASCLVVMTVLIASQVITRYVFEYSFDWSEELARYLFIWSIYVGCSFAAKEDRHLEVTILRSIAGGKLAKPVTLISQALTVAFCLACGWWGIEMVRFLASTGQNTPALEIPVYWVFLSVPLGLGLMALRTLERMWRLATGQAITESTEEY